jgi:hypothetical protein
MPNNFHRENAKFEDVAKDLSAVDLHYQKYLLGSRYKLALHCFQYVEQSANANQRWAIRIKEGVHNTNVNK